MVETGRREPGTISGESLRVRENMMMSHPAPQRDSPSTAALEDHKKGDFFPGAKEGLSLGGSGPVKNGREFTTVNGTVQFWPKAYCKWYLLPTHHSPENW